MEERKLRFEKNCNSVHIILLLSAALIRDVLGGQKIANDFDIDGHHWGGGDAEGMGIFVKEESRREKREVGPQMENNNKKYKRLEHSITIQADIRSR